MEIVGKDNRVPIFLVTGFLGAGKTTFMNQFLSRLHRPGETLAVLMNEFGDVGIDGALISDFDHISELNKGSIFCVCVRDDFLAELDRIARKVRPDVLVVEATGIADPLELGSFIDSPQLAEHYRLAQTIAIVDPVVFPKVVDTVRAVPRQVEAADIVLLNKVDAVDQNAASRVQQLIRQINPEARVYPTSYCAMPDDVWCELIHSSRGTSIAAVKAQSSPVVRDPMVSYRIAAGPFAVEEELGEFLGRLPIAVVRAKGFVMVDGSVRLVQFVAGQWSLSDGRPRDVGSLVVIGNLLRRQELESRGFKVVPLAKGEDDD